MSDFSLYSTPSLHPLAPRAPARMFSKMAAGDRPALGLVLGDSRQYGRSKPEERSPTVVVCAEQTASAAKVIPHAQAVAAALAAELLLVHVIEAHQASFAPSDPFEWDPRRREAEAFVSDLSK